VARESHCDFYVCLCVSMRSKGTVCSRSNINKQQ
jgi:hypothetical protein